MSDLQLVTSWIQNLRSPKRHERTFVSLFIWEGKRTVTYLKPLHVARLNQLLGTKHDSLEGTRHTLRLQLQSAAPHLRTMWVGRGDVWTAAAGMSLPRPFNGIQMAEAHTMSKDTGDWNDTQTHTDAKQAGNAGPFLAWSLWCCV